MHIVLIANSVVQGDGQGRVNFEIVRHALVAGHSVTMITSNADDVLLREGARLELVVVRKWPIFLQVVQFARRADRTLQRVRSEFPVGTLIVANGAVISQPHDLNLCQFVHSAWLSARGRNYSRGPADWAYQKAFTWYNMGRERVAYANAKHIVTPSHRTRQELSDIGVPDRNVTVIPNGVDLDEFRPGRSDRTALGLPDGVPLIMFAGDLRTNRKGLRYVLQALRRLPQVHLAVLGRSSGSPFIPYAASIGVSNRVTFLDFRRDVANVMKACDLFVFPSAYDPYGMVVTEALACGIPVVTSGSTGASELLTDQCGTVISDPTDVAALTAAIASWIEPPGRAAAASTHCRWAVRNHSWAEMGRKYLDLLVVILASH